MVRRYGIHIRAHPEFVKMMRRIKLDIAVDKGVKLSDVDITKMICSEVNTKKGYQDIWRIKW